MSDYHLGGSDSTSGTWMPDVFKDLVERFDVYSLIDVGCGRGENTKWFHDNRIYAIGVEGFQEYIEHNFMPKHRLVVHDYTTGPWIPSTVFDVAWSSEFVEHVEERFIANFMETFKKCRFACITHATPGQGGYHHVNERPTQYWISEFGNVGFTFLPEITEQYRSTGPNTAYGRRTLTVFKNNQFQ